MANRLVKGILNELDDALGTDLIRRKTKLLPGVTITAVPPKIIRPPEPTNVHPDLLRGLTDPNVMLGGSFERGVSLNTYPKVRRMFHATNRRMPYDQPIGDISDVGLHLSPSPNVTDYYALGIPTRDTDLIHAEKRGELTPGLSLAGPRTYPLYVDPGNVFTGFPVDAGHWNDPRSVASQAFENIFDENLDTDMLRILTQMEGGKPVDRAFRDQGYDSVEYPHHNMYYPRAGDESAMMVFDPTRVIPEYSTLGQQIGRTRGVLAAKTQSDAPGNTEEFLGDINAPSSNIHEVMDQLWDPTPQNIRDELLSLNWELGMAGKDDKDWIAHKLMTKWDEYVKVAKPEDVEFVKSNMFTSDGKPKGLTSNQQAPWINKPTGPPTKMLK